MLSGGRVRREKPSDIGEEEGLPKRCSHGGDENECNVHKTKEPAVLAAVVRNICG